MKSPHPLLANGLLLLGLTLLAVALLSGLQQLVAERTRQAERALQSRELNRLLPPELRDDALLDSRRDLQHPLLGSIHAQPAYIAQRQGRAVAVILPATAVDGYNGSIHLQVAIRADGRISAVRLLEHRETPGLGDRIEAGKSHWLQGFSGKSLDDPAAAGWTLKKQQGEFDQFAGATITPRAVVHAVRRTLQYFEAHRQQLLDTAGQR
ncbi:electron transport complex subunit RsxG [Stutzerimonas kirkiae]|uniref:electron transport complex subunit RsxG n=1 Tax=Stutzerimonas kirkiae TaxID=2211392 RepID=UPI001F614F9B|nr:electron transport complex subunit RsxG [Stutzerimonas kirkiae]